MSGGSCQQILSSFLVSSLAFIGFLRDGPWGKAPQQLRALGALEPGSGPFEDSFQVFQLDRLDSILEHECTSSQLASFWRDQTQHAELRDYGLKHESRCTNLEFAPKGGPPTPGLDSTHPQSSSSKSTDGGNRRKAAQDLGALGMQICSACSALNSGEACNP